MAYHLIAQTESKQHLGDAYQLFIYQELASAPGSVATIELISDYNLKRGSASTKDKLEYIKNTVIDFHINDVNRFLINTMKDKPDSDFKGILKKNGTNFFIGYLSLFLSKFNFTKTDTQIKLSLYDGLNGLKDYKEVQEIGTGLQRVSDIFRTIFNKLDYQINIHHYTRFSNGFYDRNIKPFYTIYQKIKDLSEINNSGTSYYDILLKLCVQHQLTIYQENAVWVLRQNTSLEHIDNPVNGIYKEIITYNSSSPTTVSQVSMDAVIYKSDLEKEPSKFYFNIYNQVNFDVSVNDPESFPKKGDDPYHLEWLNPDFKDGSTGWTTIEGTPNFINGTVYMEGSESIAQTTGDLLAGEVVTINALVDEVRMVLNDGDLLSISQNRLIGFIYFGVTNNYYYDANVDGWDLDSGDYRPIGIAVNGIKVGSTYLEEYSKVSLQVNKDLTMPNEDGVLRISLHGGGAASGNNYSYEYKSRFHYCNVIRKIVTDQSIYAPQKLSSISKINAYGSELTIDVPYLQFHPFNSKTIWVGTKEPSEDEVIARAYEWYSSDGYDPLSELYAKRLLKYNRKNAGYDLKISPDKAIEFTNVFAMDLESTGTTNYFIAVYEERELLSGHKRFIIMQNEASSETIETHTEFIFSDAR